MWQMLEVVGDIFSTAKTVWKICLLTYHQLNMLSCISKKEVLIYHSINLYCHEMILNYLYC
jgi:hypothetical protein